MIACEPTPAASVPTPTFLLLTIATENRGVARQTPRVGVGVDAGVVRHLNEVRSWVYVANLAVLHRTSSCELQITYAWPRAPKHQS
jgi:hypothetical protein